MINSELESSVGADGQKTDLILAADETKRRRSADPL